MKICLRIFCDYVLTSRQRFLQLADSACKKSQEAYDNKIEKKE